MINDNDEYVIDIVENESDARLCARLIAEQFVQNNPLFIGTNADEFYNLRLCPLILELFDQKLCFVVRHRPSNEIIGGLIASDLFLYCEKHPCNGLPPISDNPRSDLFNEMRYHFVQHQFGQFLKQNLVLYIIAVATHSSHSNKGILSKLIKYVYNYAKDQCGFEYVFVQTVHPATRFTFVNKMNGKILNTVHPASWFATKDIYDKSNPMKDYQGEPICNVVIHFNENKS